MVTNIQVGYYQDHERRHTNFRGRDQFVCHFLKELHARRGKGQVIQSNSKDVDAYGNLSSHVSPNAPFSSTPPKRIIDRRLVL